MDIVMAYIVMTYIVMAWMAPEVIKQARYAERHGYGYGLYSYGLYSYGLDGTRGNQAGTVRRKTWLANGRLSVVGHR